MHKHKTAGRAARPCKKPAALTLEIKIPAATVPLLKACAALNETTPQKYVVVALVVVLTGEAESFANESRVAIAALEGCAS